MASSRRYVYNKYVKEGLKILPINPKTEQPDESLFEHCKPNKRVKASSSSSDEEPIRRVKAKKSLLLPSSLSLSLSSSSDDET